jgi:REP element-mobilizing transposase RayT
VVPDWEPEAETVVADPPPAAEVTATPQAAPEPLPPAAAEPAASEAPAPETTPEPIPDPAPEPALDPAPPELDMRLPWEEPPSRGGNGKGAPVDLEQVPEIFDTTDAAAATRPMRALPRESEEPEFKGYGSGYTCVLIPRNPQQVLSGEIKQQLEAWLPGLVSSFGWRLNDLLVQPQYLQWTVWVSPAVTQVNPARIISKRTSQFILKQFPELKEGLPDGNFWEPGYLIVSGSQPPTPEILHSFIQQTRSRQTRQQAGEIDRPTDS